MKKARAEVGASGELGFTVAGGSGFPNTNVWRRRCKGFGLLGMARGNYFLSGVTRPLRLRRNGDENGFEREASNSCRERTEVGFGLEPLSPLVNVTPCARNCARHSRVLPLP